tara:strand:- start:98 stop:775 length:678 start_codon:yes stop_codon:yes gene_type:complete
MKKLAEISEKEINLICDYLCNPSKDQKTDHFRREELYWINFIGKELPKEKTPHDCEVNGKNKYCPIHGHKNCKDYLSKYLPGPLGEGIVKLYYEALNIEYIPNPGEQRYINKFGEESKIRPDGLVNDSSKSWVECKMRSYCSTGTANEKIPSVPRKYKSLGNLTLFLLADDEHLFNREWSAICRGDIKNMDEIDKLYMKADNSILKEIIYGTEVAKVLKNYSYSN